MTTTARTAPAPTGTPDPAGASGVQDPPPPATGAGGTGSDGDGAGTGPSGDQQQTAADDPNRAGGERARIEDLAKERKRRKAAEERVRALEQQYESDPEAREREIREQAQAPAIRALRVSAVEMAAAAAGFVYPEDAYRLLDSDEIASIDVDLEGDTPAPDRDAVTALVKALAKRRPGLLKTAGDEGKGGRPPAGAGGADLGAGRNGAQSAAGANDPNTVFRHALRSRRRR
jgi:hypothetical protein